MRAMTWYDHETESIWSQPWGRAIIGPYKGIELFLLPSELTTWGQWRSKHPHTVAMINNLERFGTIRYTFSPDFVIGLVLAGQAKGYYFEDVAAAEIINDAVGDFPIAIWASGETWRAYVRDVDGRTLTFAFIDDRVVDLQTGSSWDFARGLATDGPLAGHALQPVPSMSAFDWAWADFYPQAGIYQR